MKSVFATEAGAAALGFVVEQVLGTNSNAYPLDSIGNLAEVTGGSIHSTTDADIYRFTIDAETAAFGDASIVLQNITTVSQLIVNSAVLAPIRAAAKAASVPACPAPITRTS